MLLEADGRRPNSDIARITGLSGPTVAERIARLRDIGVIRGFKVNIDQTKLGRSTQAIIEFSSSSLDADEAVEFARHFPEIRDCYRVTGEPFVVLMVCARDNHHLCEVLKELNKQGKTRTSVVMFTEWEDRVEI